MNGLNSSDKTDREYSLAPTDELIRFWRSKVKVTSWFKYVVAKVSTSTLGSSSQSSSFELLSCVEFVTHIVNVIMTSIQYYSYSC